jgi:predicted amidohydrolase YtcJ
MKQDRTCYGRGNDANDSALGIPSLAPKRMLRGKQVGNDAAVARIKAKASERADNLRAIVEDMRAHGVTTVRTLAAIYQELRRLQREQKPRSP